MSDDIVAGAAKKSNNTIFRLNIKIAVHERELQRNYLLKVAHLSPNRRHIHANQLTTHLDG